MTSEVSTNKPRRFPRLSALWQNPVTVKELRSRMRGPRAFVILTAYLLLMSALILFVYALYAAAANGPFGPNPALAGKVVFGAVIGIQALLVIFIGPSFTSGAISGEKDRQTYNLLRTTLLPARSLVTGKLVSALSYIFLLILASVPLQSIAFLLGGVSLVEMLVAEAVIAVGAVAFALIGLFFSSLMRSTLAASITTFISALFLTFGLPVVGFIFMLIAGSFLFSPGTPDEVEVILVYTGLFLAATNLPATLAVTQGMLIERNTLFFYTDAIAGYKVYLFSPWYVFIVFYIVLSIILYILTVHRVQRIPDR